MRSNVRVRAVQSDHAISTSLPLLFCFFPWLVSADAHALAIQRDQATAKVASCRESWARI